MKAALLITLLAFSLTYSSATELNTPTGLALAANGDLWVGSKNSLEKFVAESLKPGSQPQSALSIKAIEQSLNLPGVLRFDGAGNLWAANYFANTLVKYTPSQLEQSGAPVPGITIKSSSLQEPNAFVFDQNGGMWVASSSINALLYFNANQLVQGGTLTPSKTIEATQGSLNSPAGLGFDSIGGLWAIPAHNSSKRVRLHHK